MMSMGFSIFKRSSRLLTEDEFKAMLASAEVLEQDAHGLKVLRLANGDILKIFRVKRLISSARFFSYARRFCRNAERLQELGIPTVSVRELLRFSGSGNTAVLYQPLPGVTLRELGRAKLSDGGIPSDLGIFVAKLHEMGIYFRSLHFGNIVLTPDGELGLIDISDMRFLPRKLSCGRRFRNFNHMRRLKSDMAMLEESGWKLILDNYLGHTSIKQRCIHRLRSLGE